MRTALALGLLSLTLAASARAEPPDIFAAQPYDWREDQHDKRFNKTRLAKLLDEGPKDAACAHVAGALLMALAETAPYLHKKDDQFIVFQVFLAPMNSDRFAAFEFFTHMVHRVMIDKKVPERWLETAKALKDKYQAPIDLARLGYAVDGIEPIDSVYFALPTLVDRFKAEVVLAPTIAQASARQRFEDRYLDRDVTWGGLLLSDVKKAGPKKPPKKKAKTADEDDSPEEAGYTATLLFPLKSGQDSVFGPAPTTPVQLTVKLQPDQYVDLKQAVRSGRFLVKGRLWSVKPGPGGGKGPLISEIELRDGLIFEDRDWSRYEGFASAEDVAGCDAAVNDLSPQGLKQQQGIGQRDGFSH